MRSFRHFSRSLLSFVPVALTLLCGFASAQTVSVPYGAAATGVLAAKQSIRISINGTAGDVLALTAYQLSSSGDLCYRLLPNANGSAQLSGACKSTTVYRILAQTPRLPATQNTYILELYNNHATQTASFWFVIGCDGQCLPASGTIPPYPVVEPFPFDGKPLPGSVSPANPIRTFSAPVVGNARYTVTAVSTNSTTIRPNIIVFGPGGMPPAITTCILNNGDCSRFTASRSGTMLTVVHDDRYNASLSFNWNITCDSGPACDIGRDSLQSVPSELNYEAVGGAAGLISQVLLLSSTRGAEAFQLTPQANWISVSATQGILPAYVRVTVLADRFPGGTASTTLNLTAGGAALSIPISVRLGAGRPGDFQTDTNSLRYQLQNTETTERKLVKFTNLSSVSNRIVAKVPATANWIDVSPAEFTVPAGGTQLVTVGVKSATLPKSIPIFRDTLRFNSDSVEKTIDITASKSTSDTSTFTPELLPRAITLYYQEGGDSPDVQDVLLLNDSKNPISWFANPQSEFLQVTPTARPSGSRPFDRITIGLTGLAKLLKVKRGPNQEIVPHEGSVVIQLANGDELVVTVKVMVVPGGLNIEGPQRLAPRIRPSGIILSSSARTANFFIANNSAESQPVEFDYDKQTWTLQVPSVVGPLAVVAGTITPTSKAAESGARSPIKVRFPRISIAGGQLQEIDVAAIGTAVVSGTGASGPRFACSADQVTIVSSSLPSGFVLDRGLPATLEATIQNGCSDSVSDAAVTATFSSTEAPVSLRHAGNGIWRALWTPLTSSTSLTVRIAAKLPTNASAETTVTGSVISGADVPLTSEAGIVNASDLKNPGLVAPGSIISIFGQNLYGGSPQSLSPPQQVLNGLSVRLGSAVLPLLFASPSQVNALVPFTILPGSEQPLSISRGESKSSPVSVSILNAVPGLFVSGATQQALVVGPAGVVTTATPAVRGQAIVIYATGLGPVDPIVRVDQPAPANPLSTTKESVFITVGSRRVDPFFAGLSPGWFGLYQINALLPADSPAGDRVPIAISVGGLSSSSAFISIR